MKAFNVIYNTAGSSNNTVVVLVKDETEVEQALANRDEKFKVGSPWSTITRTMAVPISKLMLVDLTVVDYLQLVDHLKRERLDED